jgi:hypothetical protein
MISAAQMLHVAFAFHHERPAVRADIGEAAERVIPPAQNNRLIQTARQKSRGKNMSWGSQVPDIAHPLPTTRKDALL